MTLSIDQIEKNWETFEHLVEKCCGEKGTNFLDKLGTRIAACPLNMKESQGGAYPGGLIEHALTVTMTMRKIVKTLEIDNVNPLSILKVGLLHDIGKIGDEKSERFVSQDSSWHRDNLGQMYKYNEDSQKTSVSHAGLFLLQSFGIELTLDEWIAIQVSQGSHYEENRFYVGTEPILAVILQNSKKISSCKTN
jgi:putative nucleotidyltransferase with HDIG domain